jgi:DNA polymerase-3 subunit epsilon
MKLTDLKILALDCQATGTNPQKGHLLEIGWLHTHASAPAATVNPKPQTYLVRLPAEAAIPRAVQRITGLSAETLPAAVPADIVWDKLLQAAGAILTGNHAAACPLVIHFARFEEPFLQDLHRRFSPAIPFPFRIICTHEIAIRLLPDLPRRGIRAIAGYYGHRLTEFKRSGDHAVATAFIWKKMVERLNTTCGISESGQLFEWLASTRPAGRSKRTYPMNPLLRRQLPDKPGIYRMLRTNGDLLYVGKAKSLKQRVNSYFRGNAPHAEHILEMLTQARGLDVTLTGSALEAAVLESDEIKRRSPPYNIALRRRQRQLMFCAKDLSGQALTASENCTVGPLPAGKTGEALAAFGAWFKNGMRLTGANDTGLGYAVIALPPEYAPDVDCLKQGLDRFRRHHGTRRPNQSALRFLTGLGAKLWQQRLDAAALAETEEGQQSDADDPGGQPDKSEADHVWTPEAVAGALERMILQSARLIRRARWFCLLSESTLVWTAYDRPEKNKAILVFEKGSIVERAEIMTAAETPLPPGFGKSFRARQQNIDLITYDRLRVVTTELRRILAEGRNIELHLNPRVTLRRQELEKALRWV